MKEGRDVLKRDVKHRGLILYIFILMKTKGLGRVRRTQVQVKLLTDPTLWDTVMALVVTEATADRPDMEVRTAAMGLREHWRTVTNSVPVTQLIPMQPCRRETFTRKKCVFERGRDGYFFT